MSDVTLFVDVGERNGEKVITVILEENDDQGPYIRQIEYITKDMLLEVLNQETKDE